MQMLRVRVGVVCTVGMLMLALSAPPAAGQPFDPHTGNAPVEVVIPSVIPVIYGFVSPGANDATIVLRITTIITNAWFDAIAPRARRAWNPG